MLRGYDSPRPRGGPESQESAFAAAAIDENASWLAASHCDFDDYRCAVGVACHRISTGRTDEFRPIEPSE
jgi:hypothetical protein